MTNITHNEQTFPGEDGAHPQIDIGPFSFVHFDAVSALLSRNMVY
jgi:hypothetical protein